MRISITLVTLLVALATANQQVATTVGSYPSVAALLRTINFATRITTCGGVILNNRSVLSAARCFQDDGPERWRFRVGSTYWDSNSVVYLVSEIIRHDNWDEWAMHNDIAIVQTTTAIVFNANIQPASFGSYIVPTNAQLVTVGWGYNAMPVWNPTEYRDLRQVQLSNFDLDSCRPAYINQGFGLRDTQLCTGFNTESDTVPRNLCFGEPGMPLYHGSIVVGVRSYALSCGLGVPSINTRFGAHVEWIVANA